MDSANSGLCQRHRPAPGGGGKYPAPRPGSQAALSPGSLPTALPYIHVPSSQGDHLPARRHARPPGSPFEASPGSLLSPPGPAAPHQRLEGTAPPQPEHTPAPPRTEQGSAQKRHQQNLALLSAAPKATVACIVLSPHPKARRTRESALRVRARCVHPAGQGASTPNPRPRPRSPGSKISCVSSFLVQRLTVSTRIQCEVFYLKLKTFHQLLSSLPRGPYLPLFLLTHSSFASSWASHCIKVKNHHLALVFFQV